MRTLVLTPPKWPASWIDSTLAHKRKLLTQSRLFPLATKKSYTIICNKSWTPVNNTQRNGNKIIIINTMALTSLTTQRQVQPMCTNKAHTLWPVGIITFCRRRPADTVLTQAVSTLSAQTTMELIINSKLLRRRPARVIITRSATQRASTRSCLKLVPRSRKN